MKRKKVGLTKRVQWRSEHLAFLAVERFIGLFPLTSLWTAGAALSGVARLFASRWPTVRNNLRTVLGPDPSDEDIATLTHEVFRHTAGNLLTALKGAHMPPETVKEVHQLENVEAGERALAQGKGMLLVVAHMGNWEFLAQAMGAIRPDVRISNIYRPLNNLYLDKVIRERREKRGMKMFAKLTSLHAPVRFVQTNGVLSILVDQPAGRFGTLTPFFGRLMSMSPLPEFIHKKTGAPVLGVSMRTTAPGQWTVKLHEPAYQGNEAFTTAHLAALMEEVIRESVVDEFWMQNLWRVNKQRPLEIRGKTGPVRLQRDRDKPLYPFSVLVRVSDHSERFAETIPALTALAASRPDLDLHLLAREALRPAAAASMVPHSFHSIEDDALPARTDFQLAVVLTNEELPAREVARLYSGPIYSLPGIAHARHTWDPIPVDESLPPQELWLQALRTLGLHDPPLEWVYV